MLEDSPYTEFLPDRMKKDFQSNTSVSLKSKTL